MLAGNRVWDAMPDEQKALVMRHFDEAVLKQHDDFARQDIALKAELEAKHLRFNEVDHAEFVQALDKANYYKDWKARLWPGGMGEARKYTGPLGRKSAARRLRRPASSPLLPRVCQVVAPWAVEKKFGEVASPAKNKRPSTGAASTARIPAWPGKACE